MDKTRPKAHSPFEGRWHIISMPEWDEDYIHEQVQAFIEFDANGAGEFQFAYIRGEMDWCLTTREEGPAVEWCWQGYDERDPEAGGGWAVLRGDELHGLILFNDGEECNFVGKRAEEQQRPEPQKPGD